MFCDWKNQYCQIEDPNQGNVQIQYNLYEITNGIFHRTGTKTFTICMETSKTPKGQSNLEREELRNLAH